MSYQEEIPPADLRKLLKPSAKLQAFVERVTAAEKEICELSVENRGFSSALSDRTRKHLEAFRKKVDADGRDRFDKLIEIMETGEHVRTPQLNSSFTVDLLRSRLNRHEVEQALGDARLAINEALAQFQEFEAHLAKTYGSRLQNSRSITEHLQAMGIPIGSHQNQISASADVFGNNAINAAAQYVKGLFQ